jgi:hypothetical protein
LRFFRNTNKRKHTQKLAIPRFQTVEEWDRMQSYSTFE